MGVNNRPMKICHISNDRDYISKLPEDIISDIFSRLSTKDVFRTSILSKDWKYNWTCINVVDLDDGYMGTRRKRANGFAEFVDMILFCCEHLKSFRLVCGWGYDICRAHRWISIALMHTLESFVVDCNVSGIVYPSSLLNSPSLRRLDLSCTTLNVASNNVAPKLTSLRLSRVKIIVENPNTHTVTFTFPSLETYTVDQSKWLDVNSVEIYAPSLKTFVSMPYYSEYAPKHEGDHDHDYSYVLIAPRLATFVCDSSFPEELNSLNGSSVVSATFRGVIIINDFTLLTKIGVRVSNLLNKFANLETLDMRLSVAQASRLGPPLHCHRKLRRLNLLGHWTCELIFYMLHAAPSLKSLRMEGVSGYDEKIERVPSCIISRLEEVEFAGRKWEAYNESQCKFAKFLLEKAERLRKISLLHFCEEKHALLKLHVMETLSGLTRRSPCVIIE